MASLQPGGSKAAIAALARQLHAWQWPLFDAQLENPHLRSLGGEAWPRARFLEEVARLVALPGHTGSWTGAFGEVAAAALAG